MVTHIIYCILSIEIDCTEGKLELEHGL